MCTEHTHAKLEEWITPETSRHLSAKMVHLWPGDSIPTHSTGPGREEVIVCLYGSIVLEINGSVQSLSSGEALFIPENTLHSVRPMNNEGAQYCYVVTKKQTAKPMSVVEFCKTGHLLCGKEQSAL